MSTSTGRAATELLTLVAAAGLALVGCSSDGSDASPAGPAATIDSAPTADPPPTNTRTTADRDAAIAAAIDVRAFGCGPRVGFGTGSVVGSGDIVTAAHVVAGAIDVEVTDVEGTVVVATVIVFDPDADFAVLRPESPIGTPAPVRQEEARADEVGLVVLPRLTDRAVQIEVAEVRVLRTTRINTTDIYLDADVVREGFEIEGSIDPGDSGAMVVLPGGGAGIVWARSNRTAQRAWAIDLPVGLRDGSLLAADAAGVDVGSCIRP